MCTSCVPNLPPCVTFRLVVIPLRGLGSHPFFPSHVASGCYFLSAAAAGALAGVISAFPGAGGGGGDWVG